MMIFMEIANLVFSYLYILETSFLRKKTSLFDMETITM